MAGWLHVSWRAQSNETGLWSGGALPWKKLHETLGQITLGQQPCSAGLAGRKAVQNPSHGVHAASTKRMGVAYRILSEVYTR